MMIKGDKESYQSGMIEEEEDLFQQNADESSGAFNEMATNLFFLLQKDGIEINNPDQIYDDKLYIDILKVITKGGIILRPQMTEKGKLMNMKLILYHFSSLLEVQLGHIDPCDIIIHKDRESVRSLLQLVLDVMHMIHLNDNCPNEVITTIDIDDYIDKLKLSQSVRPDKFYVQKQLEKCQNGYSFTRVMSNKDSEKKSGETAKKQIEILKSSANQNFTSSIGEESKYRSNQLKDQNEAYQNMKKSHHCSDCSSPRVEIKFSSPFAVKEIKIELIKQMKNILTKRNFDALMSPKAFLEKQLNDIIKVIYKSLPKDQELTHNFIKTHVKDIHNIIAAALKHTNHKSSICKGVANSMIRDKDLLLKLNYQENQYHSFILSKQKEKHQQIQQRSLNDIKKIKAISKSVWQIQRINYVKEMQQVIDNFLQKEAHMLNKTKRISNRLRQSQDK